MSIRRFPDGTVEADTVEELVDYVLALERALANQSQKAELREPPAPELCPALTVVEEPIPEELKSTHG